MLSETQRGRGTHISTGKRRTMRNGVGRRSCDTFGRLVCAAASWRLKTRGASFVEILHCRAKRPHRGPDRDYRLTTWPRCFWCCRSVKRPTSSPRGGDGDGAGGAGGPHQSRSAPTARRLVGEHSSCLHPSSSRGRLRKLYSGPMRQELGFTYLPSPWC